MDDPRLPDTLFLDLPDSLLLEIVSYLPVPDQLKLSETCQRLQRVVFDDIQWHRNLREDKHVLYIRESEVLNSVLSRAAKFEDHIHTVVSDPHHESFQLYNMYLSKEQHLKSTPPKPEVATSLPQRLVTFMGSFFKSKELLFPTLPPAHTPENAPVVTMFGPGLESVSTKAIVKKILNSRSNQLCAMATTRGNQSIRNNIAPKTGRQVNLTVGGGIIVKFYDKYLQFVTLYSNTQLLREGLSSRERLKNSKLFEEDSNGQFKIKAGIISICETTAAFIYVVDISQEVKLTSDLFYDLHAFAEHNENAPVLVLACIKDANTLRHKWSTLLQEIKLHSYKQPWQISLIIVESLNNLDTALDWIVAHTAALDKEDRCSDSRT